MGFVWDSPKIPFPGRNAALGWAAEPQAISIPAWGFQTCLHNAVAILTWCWGWPCLTSKDIPWPLGSWGCDGPLPLSASTVSCLRCGFS